MAIANWNQFLAESDAWSMMHVSGYPGQLTGRFTSAIIKAVGKMERLRYMLLKASRIEEYNHHFDQSTILAIPSFRKEFKKHQGKSDKALEAMELLIK